MQFLAPSGSSLAVVSHVLAFNFLRFSILYQISAPFMHISLNVIAVHM